MESTGSSSEGDPLKRGEDGVETATAPSATELKKKSCKEVLGFAKLTHWRTAVFFLSLFLCLTIVFAFSFIIPCPVRPQYLVSWNRTFPSAGTYDFLAVEDATKDKVLDVLFVFKSAEGSQNNTCDAAGLASPCLFLSAVDGTDGETLWERPLAPDFYWAQCGLDKDTSKTWDCLVSHSDQLSAIDKHTGEVRWHQFRPSGLPIAEPALSVPDVDGDDVSDVVLVAYDSTQTQVLFLSGKTGFQIGSTVVLDFTETAHHLLYQTPQGAHYVLLIKATGVYGLALKNIAAKAKDGMETGLKLDKHWEKSASPTGFVPVYESTSVVAVPRAGETEPNLLLAGGNKVALVGGKDLQLLWSFNTSSIVSVPTFGHYNKDNVLDIVVEEDLGNHTKRIVILDGASGGVLWEVNLLNPLHSPRPISIHTTNSFSIFVFWGLMPAKGNLTVPTPSDRRSYMLLPLYSNVLLESTPFSEQILMFRATLLERGRHAAYIALTGPGTEGEEGSVTVSKRKLKQDIPNSTVLRIGGGGAAAGGGGGGGAGSESNDDIKETFNRIRFSEW